MDDDQIINILNNNYDKELDQDLQVIEELDNEDVSELDVTTKINGNDVNHKRVDPNNVGHHLSQNKHDNSDKNDNKYSDKYDH